jgi:putative heme-binding domain-containing protein
MPRLLLLAPMFWAALMCATRPAGGGDGPALRVMPGFRVRRAALDGAVRYPMFAAFDERGRLFVSESSGLDLYAEITAGTRKCRVSVLEDRDGDGHFERSHVFADRLVFPMGLAWRDGRLYVADPPDLVALEDSDGDGRADRRTVILTGFGHIDNGSLHGIVFGPDGLLYMTMGTPDGYRLKAHDGRALEGKSGALIRCRPDGSQPEVVCRGFVNLVEVVFLPGGDAIGTDNWFQEPARGFRDALVHLAEGGLYSYVSDNGTPFPVTGEPLPPITRFPAVALSGLARYRGTAFPPDFRGNLFSAQHNARAIGRHRLVPEGTTFRSQDSVFVSSEDPDFHPSDVLEDADGSLLVIDTGAWYLQHCPTGRIRESGARGGIYRITYESAARPEDARGMRLDWARLPAGRLAALLGDPRPAVRDRAGRELATRGASAIAPLRELLRGGAHDGKVEAVWSLAAISDPAALAVLRSALSNVSADVACAAARGVGLKQDAGAAAALVHQLESGPPRVRLAAAEALAHCGSLASLPAIWRAVVTASDPFFAHSLAHAVHRLADAGALEAALKQSEPAIQAVALRLLDQPPRPRGQLQPGFVVARASSPDPGLRRAALYVLMRHPEWSSAALDHIRDQLGAADQAGERLAALADLVLAFQDEPNVQGLLARAAANRQVSPGRRAWALSTMTRTHLAPLPQAWVEALAVSLRDPEPVVRATGLRAAGMLQVPSLDAALLAIADQPDQPSELRLEALRGALARHQVPSAAAFKFLTERLAARDSPLAALAAAELLGGARLSDAQRLRVLEAVRAHPLVRPPALGAALAPPSGEKVAAAWVDYLESSLRAGWSPSEKDLDSLLATLPSRLADRRAALIRVHAEGVRQRQKRLAAFEPVLKRGDPGRGRVLFFGNTVACASCHRIDEDGGTVGPDLTRIGAVRSGNDLLESVLFPSASFAQGYEPYTAATKDGRILSGMIARQDADVLVLRDASGAESRLPRGEIEEIRPGETSLMPEGLGRVLLPSELGDLIAFLRSRQ